MKKNLLKFTSILISVISFCFSSFKVCATVGGIKGVELEEASKEETNEKDKKFAEDFKYNIEITKKEDNKVFEQNLGIFENFEKSNYEFEDFDLKIFKKRGVPILVYTHKVTKTIIIFIPIDNVDESLLLTKDIYCSSKTPTDSYFFRATEQNNKGLIHIAEHCLLSNETNKKINENYNNVALNAHTSILGFQIDHNSTYSTEEVVEEVLKMLLNPVVLKDEKIFNIEQRRAMIEIMKLWFEKQKDEISSSYNKEHYCFGGIPEQMETVTLDEIKDVYEKYFHPSNLLIIKYIKIDPKNPENLNKIKKFLKNLKNNYLNYFKNFKEINFNKNYFIEQKPFEEIEVSYSPENFKNVNLREKNEDNKYFSKINLLNLYELHNGKDPEMLKLNKKFGKAGYLNCNYAKNKRLYEIEDFVKELGYKSIRFKGIFEPLFLYGDDPNVFTEKALRENSKKILNFICSKFEEFNLEDIEMNLLELKPYNYANKNAPENKEKIGLKSDILNYYGKKLENRLILSFYYTLNPISDIFFNLTKENELEDISLEDVKKAIPELKKFVNDYEDSIIKVFKHVKIEKPDKEHEEIEENLKRHTFYPIKLKDCNNDPALNFLVSAFLNFKFNEKIYDDAINYNHSSQLGYPKEYLFSVETLTNQIREDVLKYVREILIYYVENIEASEKEFKLFIELIEQYIKKCFMELEDKEKQRNTFLKAINYYLKKGLDEKSDVFDRNKGFEITKRTTRSNMYKAYKNFIDKHIMVKSFEDAVNYFKNNEIFFKKYGQFKFSGLKSFLIDKTFIKDLNELLIKPNLKRVEWRTKFFKDFMKRKDELKFSDFKKAIKSVELVEKTKYEKDQKIMDEFDKKIMFLEI